MTESAFMQVVERIEAKLDDIRDKVHETMLMTSGTQIKQVAQEKEISDLKKEVAELKSAYDKASGAWKLMSLPGMLSLVYAISQILSKP